MTVKGAVGICAIIVAALERQAIVLGRRAGTVAKRRPARKSGAKQFPLSPPIPKGFDAAKATPKELRRHGLPLRPDPSRDPGLTAIWDRSVRHIDRDFEHLQA